MIMEAQIMAANTKIWRAQGGASETFESGATLNLNSGAVVKNAAGTDIMPNLNAIGVIQTLTGAGAIDTTSPSTRLVTTGANALTLAAPTVPGLVKTIRMLTDGGDGTLASTNIVGQSSGSTSITFNDANDMLVLVAVDTYKWAVLKEIGVTAA